MGLFDYDNSSIDSILKYTAENLIGRSLHDILEEFQSSEYKTYEDKKKGTPSTTTHKEISKLSKGIYGSLVEKLSYGIDPNNSPDPDIPAARVEIKTTPYRVNANGTISAKERLVLSMFNFHEENLDDFYQTHLWHKCQNILLLFYKYQKTRDILNNITDKFFLFDWPEEDMPTILEDYKRITQKVLEGRAHELSESDGMYLSTCRKGAGKDKDRTTQPYGPELANRRAWSLKSSYMTTLLRTKVFSQEEQESIARAAQDTSKPFTQIIEEKLLQYRGQSENESGDFCLDQIKFWGFPEPLEPELMRVWQETKEIINRGVELTVKPNGEDGFKVSTNFPQSKVNKYLFTKVHASQTYYEVKPGEFVGKGKLKDTDELPDGSRITKHSFWLPKKFVQQILRGEWD